MDVLYLTANSPHLTSYTVDGQYNTAKLGGGSVGTASSINCGAMSLFTLFKMYVKM
jgi:hypothetical protein